MKSEKDNSFVDPMEQLRNIPTTITKGNWDDFCRNKSVCCFEKRVLHELDEIEDLLESPTFGLAEIKTEVYAIEKAVLSPTFGLAEIKTEVYAIEHALSGAVTGIGDIIIAINSPTFGLAEIKTEVYAIEQAVNSPTFGLADIKTEVYAIQQAVLSPTFGLAEIKTEVYAIQQKLDSITGLSSATMLTSGPFIVSKNSSNLSVSVLNNANTVGGPYNVRVYNLDAIPKSLLQIGTLLFNVSFTLTGLSSTFLYFNKNMSKGSQVEIELWGADNTVKIYSEISTSGESANVYNIFNASDYKPV